MSGFASSVANSAAMGTSFAPGWGTAIGAGAGVLTGLLSSLFGTDSEQSRATKDLMKRINDLQGYTQSDMSRDASSINRAGTTTMTNAANMFALGSGGRQNFMNASMGKVVEGEAQQGNQRMFQMEDYNKQLESKKLEMQSSLIGGLNPDTGQENFLSTMNMGMKGMSMGMEFDKSPLNNFTQSTTTDPNGTYAHDPGGFNVNSINSNPISTSLSKLGTDEPQTGNSPYGPYSNSANTSISGDMSDTWNNPWKQSKTAIRGW